MRTLFVILVVLVAVVLSTARFLLPRANEYRMEIVASISQSFGKPIEMDSMTAGLKGVHPEVVLNGVRVIDPISRKTILRFDQLRAGLNIEEWLASGNFQPRWVTIRGARLSVRRKLDGSFSVEGLDSGEEMPKWIFEEGRFELLDSEVDWQDLKHPEARLHLSNAAIRLLNRNTRHKVALDVALPKEFGKSLSIRMDLEGGSLTRECCNGSIYVGAEDVAYDKLLAGFAFEGYRVVSGRGDFRLWSRWKQSLMVDLAGEVQIRDANVSRQSASDARAQANAVLRELAGSLHWVREQHGWSLSATDLLVNATGEAWPPIQLDLRRTKDLQSQNSEVQFHASYLRLDDLARFGADLQALPTQLHDALKASAMRGEIFDLKLGMPLSEEPQSEWFVCARFERVGFNAFESFPGVNNLSGKVCGRRGRGRFDLQSAATRVELPKIFREPIELSALNGAIAWSFDEQVWKFESQRIATSNPAISASTRLILTIPIESGDAFLDLQSDFENGDAKSARHYFPTGVMTKPLVKWLDGAFLSGLASHGSALFRGPLKSFPFRAGDGVFEVLFYTKDVLLSYHADWPKLQTSEAEVRFYQAGMEIRGDHAQVMGSQVNHVRVYCDDFGTERYLVIEGKASGTLEHSIQFIKNSPLKPIYEPFFEYVSLRGNNRIGLEIKVPIVAGIDDIEVEGTLELQKARLNAFDLSLERIEGKLEFSREWLRGQGIRGFLLDAPVRVDLSDNNQGLAVAIEGSLAVEALKKRYPFGIWEFAEGESDYTLDLQIPKLSAKLYVDIDLESTLNGIEIKAPEPFQKDKRTRQRFRLKSHLEHGRNIPLELSYGNFFNARLDLEKDRDRVRIKQGLINLGSSARSGPESSGLSIFADLQTLDLAPWKNMLSSAPQSEPPDLALNLVDLRIGRLLFEHDDLGPFTLKMKHQAGSWEGLVESSLASGRFTSASKGASSSELNLTFEYLKIPERKASKQAQQPEDSDPNPASIVDLNISAEHFYWKQQDLGQLSLETRRQADGMRINRVRIRGKGTDLNLSGSWTRSGSSHLTSIAGDLSVENLGDFLSRRGGKSKVIEDSSVRARFSLQWKDPLIDLDDATLSGNAQIDFGAGSLLTVEPGIGRVFGVFNLDGLRNLLLLDFGRLFGPGLAFEDVTSSFLLREGRATISRLNIDAVPAKLNVTGEIDLAGEQFDNIVTVVPKGVVAAGASIVLTQELPGAAVDGLINRQYRISGKWDNPNIERLPGSGEAL